jgi:hypothetical protein
VLSADGSFGVGVEGEPEAKLHVAGDAIFATGHCDRIHAQYINASADVMVQERSVLGALEELRIRREEDKAGAMRLKEEVGAVNSSLLKQLETEIATKDGQIASLSATLHEHVANLTTSLKELQSQIVIKDDQIANLTIEIHKEIAIRDGEIASLTSRLSAAELIDTTMNENFQALNGQVDGFATDIQQVNDAYETLSSQVDGLAIPSGRYNIVYENCVWIIPVKSGQNCGGQGEPNCCGEGGVVTNFRSQHHSAYLHWFIEIECCYDPHVDV